MIETVGSDRLRALRAESGLLVVDFWQQSCAPCRKLEPRLEDFARRHPELTVVRVDIDTELPLARQWDVLSIPTVLVMRDGTETGRLDGLITDGDLEAIATEITGEHLR